MIRYHTRKGGGEGKRQKKLISAPLGIGEVTRVMEIYSFSSSSSSSIILLFFHQHHHVVQLRPFRSNLTPHPIMSRDDPDLLDEPSVNKRRKLVNANSTRPQDRPAKIFAPFRASRISVQSPESLG